MLLFVKQYKQEVLGVGEVALPGESGALREAANQRTAKETKDQSAKKEGGQQQDQVSTQSSPSPAAGAPNGTEDKTEYVSRSGG